MRTPCDAHRGLKLWKPTAACPVRAPFVARMVGSTRGRKSMGSIFVAFMVLGWEEIKLSRAPIAERDESKAIAALNDGDAAWCRVSYHEARDGHRAGKAKSLEFRRASDDLLAWVPQLLDVEVVTLDRTTITDAAIK